jgi:hypothetical protein
MKVPQVLFTEWALIWAGISDPGLRHDLDRKPLGSAGNITPDTALGQGDKRPSTRRTDPLVMLNALVANFVTVTKLSLDINQVFRMKQRREGRSTTTADRRGLA